MLAGIAFAVSALPARQATAETTPAAPRTTAIAWADCNYGLESLPTPPLIALVMTSDGVAIGTRATSTAYEDARAETAMIGPERFRAVAEGLDRSTLFGPPPTPGPRPSPGPGGLVPIGRAFTTDTRRGRFAVRREGEWTDWSIDRDYTKAEKAAIQAAYDAVSDPKLEWHPTAPRANAFAICRYDGPRDAMLIPASASTSKWGDSEIVVADCHYGFERSGGPPLRAYRLMRTGDVARTTADEIDSGSSRRSEHARIGSKTFANFEARLEKARFFQAQDTRIGHAMTDTRGTRLSALRDDKRTTWNSERYSGRDHFDIISAILAAVSDPGLSWSPAPPDIGAFSVCTSTDK